MDLQRLDGGLSQHLRRHTTTWGFSIPFSVFIKKIKNRPPATKHSSLGTSLLGGDLHSGLRFTRINLIGKRHYTSRLAVLRTYPESQILFYTVAN